jgi:hypothetical protein
MANLSIDRAGVVTVGAHIPRGNVLIATGRTLALRDAVDRHALPGSDGTSWVVPGVHAVSDTHAQAAARRFRKQVQDTLRAPIQREVA